MNLEPTPAAQFLFLQYLLQHPLKYPVKVHWALWIHQCFSAMCWQKFAVLVSHCRKQTQRPDCADKYKNAISWRHTREVFSLLNLSVQISSEVVICVGFFPGVCACVSKCDLVSLN